MKKEKIIIILGVLLALLILSFMVFIGKSNMVEIVLAEKIVVDGKGVELLIPKPITITNRSLEIRFDINTAEWSVGHPWDGITYTNGTKIKLHAKVYSDKETHKSQIVGSGGGVNLRFDRDILRNKTITKVSIFSDFEIELKNVRLVNWNPK